MERLPHVALSNGRRSPEEMMGTFAPPNRSALNGMGEFILAQVSKRRVLVLVCIHESYTTVRGVQALILSTYWVYGVVW